MKNHNAKTPIVSSVQCSGMLNQYEFKERYAFITKRIINGFSRAELAFLLGRTVYEVTDYEQLCEYVKMGYKDQLVMIPLFRGTTVAPPKFLTKVHHTDVSHDKRMIRGTVTDTECEREFRFVHPWLIKEEKTAIDLKEDLLRNVKYDAEITGFVNLTLNSLKKSGSFDQGCTALFLYQQLFGIMPVPWLPVFTTILKKAVYALIHAGQLQTGEQDGQVIYKIKQ